VESRFSFKEQLYQVIVFRILSFQSNKCLTLINIHLTSYIAYNPPKWFPYSFSKRLALELANTHITKIVANDLLNINE